MTTVLPPTSRERSDSRARRVLPPVLTIGGLGLATLALAVRDPHEKGSWGLCPSHALLGIDCPGCGGLRAVNDLTHLRVLDAASSNLLLVVLMPLAVVLLGRWALRSWRGTPSRPGFLDRHSHALLVAVAVTAVVFSVVRNTPAGSWLAA
ncbi:DUF2752 domain-containing protein [Nocardioides sp.]|uniref:DUF2752 domain-containing protein n=1 Tax=Nocardioides sp. TaxID=35761 RepID=UPI0035175800